MSGRSVNGDFDRRLTAWFEGDAYVPEPDELAARIAQRTRRSRRIPACLLLERWIPLTLAARARPARRLLPIVLVLVALLIVIGATIAIVGSSRPVPSPFGLTGNGLISYDANGRILVAAPDGAGPHALVAGVPNAASGTWSPDGSRLALWGDDSPDSLYVVNADGSGLHKVAGGLWISTDKRPSWSPDGARLVVSSESGPDRHDESLDVIDVERGTDTLIRDPAHPDLRYLWPAWSPAGDWIAFLGQSASGFAADQNGVWLIRPDGGGAHRLPTSLTPDVGARWQPVQGNPLLLYAAGGAGRHDIFTFDTVGNRERRLSGDPDDEVDPTWSPSGKTVAWLIASNGDPRIAVLELADPRSMRSIPSGGITTPPTWSPDGTKLYGLDSRWGGPTARSKTIVVMADGSGQPIVIDHQSSQGTPDWQRAP